MMESNSAWVSGWVTYIHIGEFALALRCQPDLQVRDSCNYFQEPEALDGPFIKELVEE